jgi:hypothetical protein
MTNRHEQLVEKVVDTFKSTLDQAALERISDAQFEDLKMMIREAISAELGIAANLVYEVARKIRHEVEKPEIEL